MYAEPVVVAVVVVSAVAVVLVIVVVASNKPIKSIKSVITYSHFADL